MFLSAFWDTFAKSVTRNASYSVLSIFLYRSKCKWSYASTITFWKILIKNESTLALISGTRKTRDPDECHRTSKGNKVFKNGPSKVCGRQPFKKFEGVWSTLGRPFLNTFAQIFFDLSIEIQENKMRATTITRTTTYKSLP